MPQNKPPLGWIQTSLGQVRIDASHGISQQAMRGQTFELFSVPAFEKRAPEILAGESIGSNKVVVGCGDVLLCKINPRINRAWIVTPPRGYPQIASTEWIVFSRTDGLSPEFLAHFFTQDVFRNYLAANVSGVGGSLMRVNARVVSQFPVNLPPSAEQERIVAKLDAILSRIGAGEAAAQRALTRLKHYRTAVLHAAVTGELTREWRKTQPKPDETGADFLRRLLATRRARWEEAELARLTKSGKPPKDDKWKARYPEPTEADITDLPRLPRGWVWASVEQTGEVVTGSTPPTAEARFFGGRVPFFKPTDLDAGPDTRTSADSLTEAGAEAARVVPAGSILVTCIGATIGKTGLARVGGATNQQINSLVPALPELSRFLFSVMISPRMQDAMKANASATTLPILNKSKFSRLPMPLPPPDEVSEIVRQVEHRLTLADRLTATLETALTRTRAWRQSVLNTAFAGQLVPHSADDEPATVLLAKIRAARELLAAQPKPKCGRGGRKKTMKTEHRKLLEVLRGAKAPMKPEELFAAAGFDESTVEAFFSELKDLVAKKKVREKRDPQDRGFVRLEVRA
jgi:type I restriction enzyme S subunit